MSLINKMLQDLDARGSAPGAAPPPSLMSVAHSRDNTKRIAAGIAAAVALALAAGAGVWWVKRAPAPVAATLPVAPVALVQQMPPELVDDEPLPEPVNETLPAVAEVEKPKPAAPLASAPGKAATAPPAKAVADTGRQMTPRQRAESAYNRALASLQEGRVREAVDALEQSILIEPRHDAARQTLVGLLMEAGQSGEAIRVLQDGLAQEPRQPSMAMLLARLQIEGGISGIDTLKRTLPYAEGSGDYHGFLAGALAKDERHREAAEQYQAALRSAPANGIWWMGLGISLQAEKRVPEAVAAYQRASESPELTPQLRAFVDRRLQLLSR